MEEEKEVQVEVPAEEPQETPAEPEPQTDETPEETPPPKPKKTAQERIDELTKIRRAEERARVKAEQEAEYWRKAAMEKPPEQPKTESSTLQRPRLDQFDSTEEYEDALFAWRDKKRDIEIQTAKRQEEQETASRTFQERARKVREEFEDFDEVIEQPVFSPAMRDALMMSESGPSLAYHLGTHPAEAERIRNMPSAMQLIEIGKLEVKLSVAKQMKKAPGAPPPLNPVGMGGGAKEVDESKLSDDEWFARKQQRIKDEIEKRKAAR